MPPKRRPATGGGVEAGGPMLKLTVEKGPLAGQSNVFGPSTRIQIGRVVRGNKLCIKDPGISSKHIAVEFDSGNWTVTDLDSSNGTFLNERLLDSDESAVLSEGDVVKIGEMTSIKVSYDVGEVAVESGGGGKVRRNARRGVRNQAVELDVIDEDSELGLMEKLGAGGEGKGKGMGSEGVGVEKEGDVEKDVDYGGGGKGKGRGKSGSVDKEVSLVDLSVDGSKKNIDCGGGVKGKGRGKGRSVDLSVDELIVSNEVLKLEVLVDSEKVEDEGVNKGKGRTRSTRGSKKVEERIVSTRATRSSRKEEVLIDLSVIEGKGRRGGRAKANAPREMAVEVGLKGELVIEQEVRDEKAVSVAVDNSSAVERLEAGAGGVAGVAETSGVGEAAAGVAGTSGVKEGVAEMAGISGVKQDTEGYVKGKSLKDLDTMTMGEWFKFLEAFLPQQIIIETEKAISEMEDKARRLHEFKLQHMRAKEKAGEEAI